MSDAWIDVRIARASTLAEDIVGLLLEPVGTQPLPPFSAGSHVDVELRDGTVRQYSLCGSPRVQGAYELGILLDRNGRGGSRAVHEQLVEGATARISAPRNLFPLASGRHHVLMAGGIGVTPILAMAEELVASGESFEIHYFVRSAARAAFLDRLSHPRFADRFHLHVGDRIPDSFASDAVLGQVGKDSHLYVCGPNAFMDFVIETARAKGWAEDHVHSERFSAAPVDTAGDAPFDIEIESSGKIVRVDTGQSAIGALAGVGIVIPVSCEQGICGTCLTSVVGGVPDHRDSYLSDAEHDANDCFTPCCSRALTPRLIVRL